MESTNYCYHLINPVTGDKLDLVLTESITIETAKSYISEIHPDHPHVRDILLVSRYTKICLDGIDYSDYIPTPDSKDFIYQFVTSKDNMYSENLARMETTLFSNVHIKDYEMEEYRVLIKEKEKKRWKEEKEKNEVIADEPKEVAGRKFRFAIARNAKERKELFEKNKHKHLIKIPFSFLNIMYAVVSFYIIYKTQVVINVLKTTRNYIGFAPPMWLIWIVFNLTLLLTAPFKQVMGILKWDKDMVDFVPNGFWGNLWLCIYYFFVTVLPWNWGPRVFRD